MLYQRIGGPYLQPDQISNFFFTLISLLFTSSFLATSQLIWSVENKARKSFSSKEICNCLRIPKPLVSWVHLIWHKETVPKHAWNPTIYVACWGLDVETCLLCVWANESRDHLFFECPFSAEIWNSITVKLLIHSLLRLGSNSYFGYQMLQTSLALLQAWHACVYEIKFVVKIIAQALQQQLGSGSGSSLLLCWSR